MKDGDVVYSEEYGRGAVMKGRLMSNFIVKFNKTDNGGVNIYERYDKNGVKIGENEKTLFKEKQ